MGREIRRVPPDWKHPEKSPSNPQPLYDEEYQEACKRWYSAAAQWVPDEFCKWYHEYENVPDERLYRHEAWTPEEATAYCLYETVSEGTPVSPVFATVEELIDYLVTQGDFWGQKRGEKYNRKSAESLVRHGSCPSMTFGGGKLDGPETMEL